MLPRCVGADRANSFIGEPWLHLNEQCEIVLARGDEVDMYNYIITSDESAYLLVNCICVCMPFEHLSSDPVPVLSSSFKQFSWAIAPF